MSQADQPTVIMVFLHTFSNSSKILNASQVVYLGISVLSMAQRSSLIGNLSLDKSTIKIIFLFVSLMLLRLKERNMS